MNATIWNQSDKAEHQVICYFQEQLAGIGASRDEREGGTAPALTMPLCGAYLAPARRPFKCLSQRLDHLHAAEEVHASVSGKGAGD
jgi:hypothetical protein